MTQQEFWNLHDSGTIECKIFVWEDEYDRKTVEAFEYNGKFFLRIIDEVGGRSWYSEVKHRMTHTRGYINTRIKEFDTKAHANNYFKKVFEGYTYKKVQG